MAVEDQYAKYRRAWRAREAERQAHLAALAEDARREARALAQILATEYGATRVILFGSLARGTPQREEFDIDLAVEGIPPDRFPEARIDVSFRAGRELDLLDLQSIREGFRELILKYGIPLYEQRDDRETD